MKNALIMTMHYISASEKELSTYILLCAKLATSFKIILKIIDFSSVTSENNRFHEAKSL